jgi:hypothetical protein
MKWVCEMERKSEWPDTVPDNFGRDQLALSWDMHMEHAKFASQQGLIAYYEFPPMASQELTGQTRYDPKYTSKPIVTEADFFEKNLSHYQGEGEFDGYTHFAYVEIDRKAALDAPGFV